MKKSEYPKTYWKTFGENLKYHVVTKIREPSLKVGQKKLRNPIK